MGRVALTPFGLVLRRFASGSVTPACGRLSGHAPMESLLRGVHRRGGKDAEGSGGWPDARRGKKRRAELLRLFLVTRSFTPSPRRSEG